jgi:hypothetical protein
MSLGVGEDLYTSPRKRKDRSYARQVLRAECEDIYFLGKVYLDVIVRKLCKVMQMQRRID